MLNAIVWTLLTKARCLQSQPQPLSYSPPMFVNRNGYAAAELGRLYLNSYIPEKNEELLRLATYNIHFHRDIFNKMSNVADVLCDIRRMDADVLMLQEVLSDPENLDRLALEEGLEALSYTHRYFGAAQGSKLGNMIASRLSLHELSSLELGNYRILLKADIRLADGSFMGLYATHLQNADPSARTAQCRQIISYLQQSPGQLFVLAGDFNGRLHSPGVSELEPSGLMMEAFGAADLERPRYTCWAGNPVDFVFVSKEIRRTVAGAYVFHSLSSDHLPVLTDLNLNPVV